MLARPAGLAARVVVGALVERHLVVGVRVAEDVATAPAVVAAHKIVEEPLAGRFVAAVGFEIGLPVSPCGLAFDLGVVGQIPVPIHGIDAVTGRPPRQFAQAGDGKQACEAAAGMYLPILVVRLAGG